MSTYGERLAELRKQYRLTQADFATILGISTDMLSKYERGKVMMPDEMKIKVAKFFDVSLDYMFGLINEEVSFYPKNRIIVPNNFTDEAIEKLAHYIKLLGLELREEKAE